MCGTSLQNRCTVCDENSEAVCVKEDAFTL